MSLKSEFESVEHAIAAGAKYFASELVPGAVKVASKAAQLEPEADLILTAIAGPAAAQINDLAMGIFGRVAGALVPLGADASAQVSAHGLNLPLDAQTVSDVLSFSNLIQQLLKAKGTPAPAKK